MAQGVARDYNQVSEDESKQKYYVLDMFPYPLVQDYMWGIH